ncbi:MAG: long-chain fatty acid--CoA ligase [Bythopirellula sp.]
MALNGLMMDYPLTLNTIQRRAETIHGDREVVTRLPDRSWHRYSYREMSERAKRLALALQRLGVASGDRVATLCWNHYRHLEAYFGIPASGAVLHTLNLRLHPDDLVHIINEADDRVVIVDDSLLPLLSEIRDRAELQHVVVVSETATSTSEYLDYEALIEAENPEQFEFQNIDENQAASMCYTSGTVGKPKGVVYSHRAIAIHTLGAALTCGFEIWESDCLLPVVPMFHVNCWGLPYIAAMMGAKLVLPGPNLDPQSLLEAYQQERVTWSAGVPTIWLALLDKLDENPGAYDLSALRKMIVGGAALPQSLLEAFEERHQLNLVPAWGMTETTPMGTTCYLRPGEESISSEQQNAIRCRQGTPVPFVELRARGDNGLIDWDGKSMGELEVQGPWIAAEYFNQSEANDSFTEDGWFRTGDIVSINERGSMKIEDRAKDLIKSGGEWISSLDLENSLLAHPAVAQAAVVAVAHEKWGERPLALIVARAETSVSADELRDFLAQHHAKWWIPDAFEFVDEIPKTTTGKISKKAIREQFAGG